MKLMRALPLMALGALLVVGCTGDGDSGSDSRYVVGETQVVHEGHSAQTYARLNGAGKVMEAGVTVPYEVIETPPGEGHDHMTRETGPAGSFITLDWPNAVKDQTFFNHYEMHWNPMGHPPTDWMVPHFDIHAYGIPEAEVMAITGPDSAAPVADRLPEGYVYPGVNEVVPQMGVHAVVPGPGAAPPKTMVLGYFGGKMIFVEPMVTQAELKKKMSFEMEIRVPAKLAKAALYPTRFRAIWEGTANRYRFVYDNFVNVGE